MNAKSFLFVAAWMKPLKGLPAEQRWNVMEAIAEYATTGQLTKELDPMETLAFLFIRNEIDRMNGYREERRERRRTEVNSPREEESLPTDQTPSEDANNANACQPIQEDAPFDIISVSESVTESESDKKSTTTSSRVRVHEDGECKNHPFAFRPAKNVDRMLRIRPSPTNDNYSTGISFENQDRRADFYSIAVWSGGPDILQIQIWLGLFWK